MHVVVVTIVTIGRRLWGTRGQLWSLSRFFGSHGPHPAMFAQMRRVVLAAKGLCVKIRKLGAATTANRSKDSVWGVRDLVIVAVRDTQYKCEIFETSNALVTIECTDRDIPLEAKFQGQCTLLPIKGCKMLMSWSQTNRVLVS